MGTMSGYYGYRAIGDFIKRNRKDLLLQFKPHKDRLPSFFTVRRVLMGIDFKELSKQFYRWSSQHVALEKGDWVSLDGKVIAGTVSDAHGIDQTFISLVSAYCSRRKLIIANAEVRHKKENELGLVQLMIKELGLKGVTFSLDALHCQKKQQL
jgi:DDE_Tnp_1-associated